MSSHLHTAEHGLATRLSLGLIRFYQRRISPHKGFRCAHAVAHGGPGCSGYAAAVIRARGVWGALALIRQRFRDCRDAFELLKAQAAATEEAGPETAEGVAPAPAKKDKTMAENCWLSGGGAGTACADCSAPTACGGSSCALPCL